MLDNPLVLIGAAYLLVLFFVMMGTSRSGFYRDRNPRSKPFGLGADMALAAIILGVLVLIAGVTSRF